MQVDTIEKTVAVTLKMESAEEVELIKGCLWLAVNLLNESQRRAKLISSLVKAGIATHIQDCHDVVEDVDSIAMQLERTDSIPSYIKAEE